MPVVIGGIVDQGIAAAQLIDERGDLRAVIRAIGDVALLENRLDRRSGKPIYQRFARLFLEVDEGDSRTLPNEAFDDSFADPRSAAADDHPLAAQAGVDRGLVVRGQLVFTHPVAVFLPAMRCI